MSEQWQNRIEIKSESSSRVYIVAQKVTDGTWACSCPGWKAHRNCKHLKTMGLQGAVPAPKPKVYNRQFEQIDTHPENFRDEAYSHYDIRHGFGSAEDWIRAAENLGAGRGRYHEENPFDKARREYQEREEARQRQYKAPRKQRPTFTREDDMRLLGLTQMPPEVKGLVDAMRRRAFIDHPDHGGSKEAFQSMFAAYERLLAWYPR
jgi:hypothetical protein